MTQFSEAAWQRTARLRAAIDALPFNTELAAGTLSRERFQGYIVQDALYLAQYSRILAIAGARGPDVETLRTFGSCALEAVAVEQALHERYLTRVRRRSRATADAEPSPDCLGYTSFLLATAYHEPWEVLVAALLPCFWIYWDVGIASRTARCGGQSLSRLDRHLRGRSLRRGGAQRDRHHRSRRGSHHDGDQGAHDDGVHPLHAVRVAVLGRRLSAARLAARLGRRILADHRRTLLADHDGRRVGVAGGQRRHHRGVDHPQPAMPCTRSRGSTTAIGSVAHPAGADRMEDRGADAARIVGQRRRPRRTAGPGSVSTDAVLRDRRRGEDAAA